MSSPNHAIFSMNGVLASSPEIDNAILAYYGQILGYKGILPLSWYREIFETSFASGLQRIIEKYDLQKPTELEYGKAEPLLRKVLEARRESGMYSGMERVVKTFQQNKITMSINTSTPLLMVEASIPEHLLNLFSLVVVGGEEGISDNEVHPKKYRGEVFGFSEKKFGISKTKGFFGLKSSQMLFFLSTVGDIREALSLGIPGRNIYHVLWGVNDWKDRKNWEQLLMPKDPAFVGKVSEQAQYVKSVSEPSGIIDLILEGEGIFSPVYQK